MVIDESLDYLKELLAQGFVVVRWITTASACEKCKKLDGQEFLLEEFISNLKFDAPIFEHSHVNCKCYLEIINENGDVIEINYKGIL